MRKWRDNEEMERDLLATFPHFLFISSLFIDFLYQKLSFCCKTLNTALLSQMSQKTEHMHYEIIILGRIRCEKSPQVVRAWRQDLCFCFLTFLLQQYRIFSPLGEVVVR